MQRWCLIQNWDEAIKYNIRVGQRRNHLFFSKVNFLISCLSITFESHVSKWQWTANISMKMKTGPLTSVLRLPWWGSWVHAWAENIGGLSKAETTYRYNNQTYFHNKSENGYFTSQFKEKRCEFQTLTFTHFRISHTLTHSIRWENSIMFYWATQYQF